MFARLEVVYSWLLWGAESAGDARGGGHTGVGGLQQGGRVPRRHKRTHWSRLASSVDQVQVTSNPKPVTNILTTYYALQKQQRRL